MNLLKIHRFAKCGKLYPIRLFSKEHEVDVFETNRKALRDFYIKFFGK